MKISFFALSDKNDNIPIFSYNTYYVHYFSHLLPIPFVIIYQWQVLFIFPLSARF